jgi:hypothetical protein
MNNSLFKWRNGKRFGLFLWLTIPFMALGEVKTWTGNGGDGLWATPKNWSGGSLPGIADDVLLDNGEFPGSYQVLLPDQTITIRTLTITPSGGNIIELILPASNKETDALTVTGPGYGILLNTGAVFRNACGITSGESLHIADSIRINSGGRYIHNTRASHATSILKILSSAPGTEKGIFEFDVPRASYTLSVSNRIYGTLYLSSTTYGQAVNYTCSGSNPLSILGDLRIGNNVSLSVNLSGLNGNILVNGDYIQEGGALNLASGAGNSTFMRIKGDLVQSPGAIITATSTANPGIELNGNRLQLISAGGSLLNGISFRVNNPSGCELLLPLSLPHHLELMQGKLISSTSNLLSLTASCSILVDSSKVNGAYVDGPLRKEGLNNEPYFLFPVGKKGSLRWMELKQATGNFTVEYMDENPASIGTALGSGIDHVSKMEYWKVDADASAPTRSNMELSFVSPQSGRVTDPAFLNVSGFEGNQWTDAGHTGITGNMLYGSVVSSSVSDFSGQAFTLASTANLENPLPLMIIQFERKEKNGYIVFSWSVESPETADHFELLEAKDKEFHIIAQIPAKQNQALYSWNEDEPVPPGSQFYKLNMVDRYGNVYTSKIIAVQHSVSPELKLTWMPAFLSYGGDKLYIRSTEADRLEYRIITMNGQELKKGKIFVPEGESDFILPVQNLKSGIYQFCGLDSGGRTYVVRFAKE